MMNLPAANAAPAQSASANAAKAPVEANAGLPPPAANAAHGSGAAHNASAAKPAGSTSGASPAKGGGSTSKAAGPAKGSAAPRSANASSDANAANGAGATNVASAGAPPKASVDGSGVAGSAPIAAEMALPGQFGAILDAMTNAANVADADSEEPSERDGSPDDAAAAAAAATMLPAMGNLPLPIPAGATAGKVAAIAAALSNAANTASATDAVLRQQAQASALAAHDADSEAGNAPAAAQLDARAAMLAAAARPLPSAGQPASPAVQPGAVQPGAGDALSAVLNALQDGQAADSSAAPLTAKDNASLLADSQRQAGQGDAGALPGFRSVLANTAASQSGDALHLSGDPEQWQQPLRAALGDRLQLQLARNDDRAMIRLEPPNMGSVEISVRHSGGALHVNIAASHSEVLRQLNTIGDAVRQDLSQRQLGEVAVTVSSSNARSLADGGQQQRQQQSGQQRQPGRALGDEAAGTTTFAMQGERE